MFVTTRKYITLTLLISGLLLTPAAYAENQGSQFSLSLDGLGQGIFIPYSNAVSFGGGGQAFLDWRPFQFISFGIGGQYSYFPMPFSFQLASVDIGGRIFPGATTRMGEFYLQGGLGKMLIINPGNYPGHYHGYAGLGWRQFLQQDFALDLGAQYDFYSPISLPLNGVSAKIGLTFLFGRDDWSSPSQKLRARTLVVGGNWTGPSTFTWQKEKDLRAVAFQVYGDEGLYPLILDANKDLIARGGLRPGVVLRIPAPPQSGSEIDSIEKEALYDPKYLKLEDASQRNQEVHQPKVKAYKWKYGDDLPLVAEKIYGEEDLYPLIVDANEERIIRPENLVPGKTLIIPRLPSDDALDEVRQKAVNDSNYLWWRNITREHLENIRTLH